MDADDGVAARGAEPTAFAAVGAATASAHRRVPLIPPLPAATATARDAPSAASARATPRAASRALGGAARRALHVEICRCLAWLHGKVRGAQEREDAARAAVGVYTRTTSAPAVKVRAPPPPRPPGAREYRPPVRPPGPGGGLRRDVRAARGTSRRAATAACPRTTRPTPTQGPRRARRPRPARVRVRPVVASTLTCPSHPSSAQLATWTQGLRRCRVHLRRRGIEVEEPDSPPPTRPSCPDA